MTCNVILTPTKGRFLAHIAELPDCKAEAKNRGQALVLIQKRLEEFMRRSEIVQLKISKPGKAKHAESRNGQTQRQAKTVNPPNLVRVAAPIAADDTSVQLEAPWEFVGIFKDDPTWWPMLEDVEKRRDRQMVHPKKKGKK